MGFAEPPIFAYSEIHPKIYEYKIIKSEPLTFFGCRLLYLQREVFEFWPGGKSVQLRGEGHQKVVPAVVTAGTGKAVGEDAPFQILLDSFANLGLGAAVVALPVELDRASQLQPGFVMLGQLFT
jgi:hypothetical protein